MIRILSRYPRRPIPVIPEPKLKNPQGVSSRSSGECLESNKDAVETPKPDPQLKNLNISNTARQDEFFDLRGFNW